MAGPFARIIANVIVMGAGVVSKAFMQAYQQAVVNAKTGKTATQAASTVIRRNQMDKTQAMEILNLKTCGKALPNKDEIDKQYQRYFTANDPAKGGSFYLQSKIFRAKETLERIAKEEAEREAAENKTKSTKDEM